MHKFLINKTRHKLVQFIYIKISGFVFRQFLQLRPQGLGDKTVNYGFTIRGNNL